MSKLLVNVAGFLFLPCFLKHFKSFTANLYVIKLFLYYDQGEKRGFFFFCNVCSDEEELCLKIEFLKLLKELGAQFLLKFLRI